MVKSLPCCHHTARSLRFHPEQPGLLLVHVGSASNVDSTPSHAQIRAFQVGTPALPAGGLGWETGLLWASGLRNAEAIDFDRAGKLWACPNGLDDLARGDLGGDIHEHNPAEELVRVDEPGAFFGYPYCWPQGLLPAANTPPGTMWATPGRGWTDEMCRDASQVTPPLFSFPAHMAPIDLLFWKGGFELGPPGGPSWRKDAFVSFHGSWDSSVPVGHRVEHLRFDPASGLPSSSETFAFRPSWRPTGMTVAPCPLGFCLYVAADADNSISAFGLHHQERSNKRSMDEIDG